MRLDLPKGRSLRPLDEPQAEAAPAPVRRLSEAVASTEAPTSRGQALVQAAYTRRSVGDDDALAPPASGLDNSQGRRRAVIRRRALPLTAAVLILLAAAIGFSLVSKPTFTATAVTYVNPGASRQNPGQPEEAAVLATTYAGLIPDDAAILHALAIELGESVRVVHQSITVVTPTSTGILKLEFKGHSAASAIAGATALARSITGANAVSSTVPTNSVLLASLPTDAKRAGIGLPLLVGAGLIVGLLLGSAIAACWEWLDPRIDVGSALANVLGTPVSDELQLRAGAAGALVQRWSQAGPPGGSIALVATRPEDLDDVEKLTAFLSAVQLRNDWQLPSQGGLDAPPETRTLPGTFQSYGAPGSDQVGQQAALNSSTVVLVVVAGTRVAVAENARRVLGHFGHAPDWGILLPRRASRRTTLLETAPTEAQLEGTPTPGPRRRPRAALGERQR